MGHVWEFHRDGHATYGDFTVPNANLDFTPVKTSVSQDGGPQAAAADQSACAGACPVVVGAWPCSHKAAAWLLGPSAEVRLWLLLLGDAWGFNYAFQGIRLSNLLWLA